MTISSFRGTYHFLSNFCESPIILSVSGSSFNGRWKTAEHLYQAMKTDSMEYKKEIYNASTPKEAKKLGGEAPLRIHWNDVKDRVMYFVVREKFTQNPDFGQRLIDTGEEELVEGNWWGDTYWGVYKGEGENKLGKILMQVRNELK